MFDLSKMSFEELQELHAATGRAMDERKSRRCQELIQNVCDAMNALASEFPLVELRVNYHCSECDIDDDIDVMDYFCESGRQQITPNHFQYY